MRLWMKAFLTGIGMALLNGVIVGAVVWTFRHCTQQPLALCWVAAVSVPGGMLTGFVIQQMLTPRE